MNMQNFKNHSIKYCHVRMQLKCKIIIVSGAFPFVPRRPQLTVRKRLTAFPFSINGLLLLHRLHTTFWLRFRWVGIDHFQPTSKCRSSSKFGFFNFIIFFIINFLLPATSVRIYMKVSRFFFVCFSSPVYRSFKILLKTSFFNLSPNFFFMLVGFYFGPRFI